jgi:DNA-binding transcriptional LysR family regulator
VARNLSFTKASAELFISQPAVTKHIKELETSYGVRLFERKGNKIGLTRAAELLLEFTEKVTDLNRELDFEFSRFKDTLTGTLRLGASTTVAQYVIPHVLSKFHSSYPQVRLSLLNGNTSSIRNALLNGEIDLGIVDARGTSNELKYEPFISDEVVAVVSSKGKLSYLETLPISKLPALPIVLRERGSGTLEVIESELKKKNVKFTSLNIVMSLGSTESLKAFIESSDCIGFLPLQAIRNEIFSGI